MSQVWRLYFMKQSEMKKVITNKFLPNAILKYGGGIINLQYMMTIKSKCKIKKLSLLWNMLLFTHGKKCRDKCVEI